MNTIKKTVTLGMIFTLLSGYPVYSQHISDSIDVVHYDIELEEINTAGHTLTGLCQITFTPKTATLHHLVLHLKDLQVDAIMYDENPLEYVHTDEILSIELPGLWTPQDTGTISIAYHGSPFSENWGGFHFSQEYAFNLGVGFESIPHNLGRAWFPCVDDFIDKATYSYHIAVEAPKSAVCGGLLQGTTVKNQKTIYHWEMEEAIPAYLASGGCW